MRNNEASNAARAIANHHIRRLDTVVAARDDNLSLCDVLQFDAISTTAAAWATREQMMLDPYTAIEASDRACAALRNIFDSVAGIND